VINLLREHFRRKDNQTQSLEYAENIPDRRQMLLDEDAREEIRHYLDRLAAEDRLLIQLCHYEGLTLEEVHALHPEWGSVTTICRRRARVYQQLRAWMSQG
jgi:DNA-directed RNA polymerase specialized sigma24 family protein